MDMSKANYGILHTHSEYSVKDSAMNLEAMFERAKELGAPAIALTDHGILANYFDFMKLGKEYAIKPIPGMEAYFVPDVKVDKKLKGTKQHLILMAKDNIGFHAISEAVYHSYTNLIEEFPRMDYEILQSCFGPGSKGHGHVIATSACMQGVLAQILLERHNVEKDTEKLHKKRDKYHPIDNELLDAIQQEEDLQQELEDLISERTHLEELAKTNVTGLKRSLKAMDPDSEDYVSISKELEDKTNKKEEAKAALPDIKKQIAQKRKAKTAYSKSIAKMKESAVKWQNVDAQISDVLKHMKSEEVLYKEAKAAAIKFSEIFGKDNFYIELQYHHIEQEKYAMPRLAKLAAELELPVVAANDAHYATNSYEDVRARTLVKAMRFNDMVDEEMLVEGYGEMYMKPDGELAAALSDILDEETVSKAMAGIKKITDSCNVELESGEHYPVFIGGNEGETAAERLRRLAIEGIPLRYPGSLWTPEMEERMEYELDVINSSGYSDYLCIVQDFLDYARSLGVKYFPAGTGYVVGPGRGSAVGSIVCYLTGITDVDPIKYGLIFERFLNKDRVSMPKQHWAYNVNPIAQGCAA